MKLMASIAACLILISMSPAAMEAFSQITGATILSGTMDLGDDFRVIIAAVGIKDGLCWEITCRWIAGRPQCLVFKNPRTRL